MTIEEALRQTLREAPRGRITFARDFQGFPGTVHGGAVAALFYRVTTPRPPVHLRMDLERGVPTETPLALETGSEGARARLAVSQDGRRLAAAELMREEVAPFDPAPTLAEWRAASSAGAEVPHTKTCLACGSANPLGLAVRFLVNDRFVWREYVPQPAYRAANGALHAALVTIMLDELAWWLGALAQGECGVTTEVSLTVYARLPFTPLLAIGDRQTVRPDEDVRGRYVRADALLLTADGTLLARAEVRFAASRAYTRRLLQPFLETTPPERFFSLFPAARVLAGREGPASESPT
jgi:hypothetical protein